MTQRMVAAEAGVSVAAVSMALRGDPQLPESTRERIRGVAKAMGYVPNPVLAAGMAQVRHRKAAEIRAVLLCLHTQTRENLERWEGARQIADGAEARAAALGYRLERHQLVPAEFRRILKRVRDLGIPGAVAMGPRWPEVDAVLRDLAQKIPVVRASGGRGDVGLHFTQIDFFRAITLAMDRLRAEGVRRIGLVMNRVFDRTIGYAFSGAYLARMLDLPEADRLAPLLLDAKEDAAAETAIRSWWASARPEAILTNQKVWSLAQWAALNPTEVPVRMVQLGVTRETPDWEGIAFPDAEMGAAAVDLVVAQIHRGERGIPAFQKGILVEGRWRVLVPRVAPASSPRRRSRVGMADSAC